MLNYLSQPYSVNHDYALAAFAFAFALKEGANSVAEVIFERAYYTAGTYSGPRVRCEIDATGKLKATFTDGTNTATVVSTATVNTATWQVGLIVGYDGTNFRLMQNGIDLAAPVARGSVGSLTNTNAILSIGLDVSGANPATNAALSLFRAGATWPSNDQSAHIYRTELPLFQAGAQCTLDGTSTAVTALAYDDNADILHVGTSWGRSAFKDLVRVESAVSVVGAITSLSANQGTHISGGASAARYYQPAMLLRDEIRRKDEARKALGKVPVFTDYDAIATQTAFVLPRGYTTKAVYSAGTLKRVGSTKDYTISFDGFLETVTFGTAPGAAAWVSIMAVRGN